MKEARNKLKNIKLQYTDPQAGGAGRGGRGGAGRAGRGGAGRAGRGGAGRGGAGRVLRPLWRLPQRFPQHAAPSQPTGASAGLGCACITLFFGLVLPFTAAGAPPPEALEGKEGARARRLLFQGQQARSAATRACPSPSLPRLLVCVYSLFLSTHHAHTDPQRACPLLRACAARR